MQQKRSNIPAPDVLPLTGKSRWSVVKKFSPISRETFRKLSVQGRAPQPERMGVRCTFYDNAELHRWLADPVNYRVTQKNKAA
jgi:prophage regulatory protein